MPSAEKLEKKASYFTKLVSLFSSFPTVLIVNADHVGSRQMSQIRHALRNKATLVMGKNTMIRTALRKNISKYPHFEKIIPYVRLNVGFIFVDEDPAAIRKIILENKVPAPAKQGVLAPIDVHIPAGPTGMDPSATSYFQALGITTKINKGQVEIIADVHVVKKDEKVSASAASLLQKLNIKPFTYGLKVNHVYDSGCVYEASVLDISNEDILKKFSLGVNNIAAVSRQIGLPTQASISHSILEGFKYCVASVLDTDYSFPQMETIKKILENPDAFVSAAPAPVAASGGEEKSTKKEEKEQPKEEESDDDMGFSLFD